MDDAPNMDDIPSFDDRWPLAWEHYFPFLNAEANTLLLLVRAFMYYLTEVEPLDVVKTLETSTFYVEWDSMVRALDGVVVDEFPNLMFQDPKRGLAALGVAAVELAYAECVGSELPGSFKKLMGRITNHGPVTQIRDLKSHLIDRMVTVHGTVVRTSAIKPMVMEMEFECTKCNMIIPVNFEDGKFRSPGLCGSGDGECKSTSFEADRSSAMTIDWQKVRVQEILDDSTYEAGRIPRTVECELTGDLVDSVVPGDVVTITGQVKVVSSGAKAAASRKSKTLFILYIDANMINQSVHGIDTSATTSSLQDLYLIKEISQSDDPFHLLVNSLCPSIYGHEIVKAGWLLALFGGNRTLKARGDPHVLVVGDPGMGKSQLLRSVASAAPRGVYVCGNTTSTTGLTVTLLKDPLSGDYALEAGALVLGDKGCCCIDEFDKMKSEHHALLEAMEQQSVSIAKAGIVANLPARTAVLAAANPIGGHYNFAKTVSENVHMAPALLSRFDLIFVLVDKPDYERDAKLSEHVMLLHGGGRYHNRPAAGTRTQQYKSQLMSALNRASGQLSSHGTGLGGDTNRSLADALKLRSPKTFDPVPHVLMRKYIDYARQHVNPQLSPGAASLLQDFYLSLRKSHSGGDTMPITTRQLESLIRLAEARAKVDLRLVVTPADAMDVIQLMKESLVDVYVDPTGRVDMGRASGTSKRAQSKAYVAELHRIAEATYNSLFTMQQLYKVATDMGIQPTEFRDLIPKLNNQGYLLKKRNNVYQLSSASVSAGGWAPSQQH